MTMTPEIKGFWQEDDAPVKNVDFANALAKALIQFAKFVEAKRIDVSIIKPPGLMKHVRRVIGEELPVGRKH